MTSLVQAAPRCSRGAQQVQHRPALSEVFVPFSCPLGTHRVLQVNTLKPVNTALGGHLTAGMNLWNITVNTGKKPASVFCKHIYLFSCKLSITNLIAN